MRLNKKLFALAAAAAVQLAILAAVPALKGYALLTGRTVTLKAAPRNPYDILNGYYVPLAYEAGRPEQLPGWREAEDDTSLYVVLREGPDGCWAPESVHLRRPETPAGRVVIKGAKEYDRILYGIESYYVPEESRKTIERDLREHPGEARMEVKVDSFGRAAAKRLLVAGRAYDR
jgi:uncharacterized membrane-anchored protein